MPLPHPSAGQSRDEYVARFMADANAQREFPDEKQRLAVALAKWREGHMQKSVLNAKERDKLKHSQFAIPEDEAYPIPDEAHARNALARVAQFGTPEEQRRVRAAVKKKFPDIDVGGEPMHKAASLRRIKSAVITTIALCRRGKNGMRTLLKADGSVEFDAIVKGNGKDELLSVVYAPERPDDDSDFADAPVIKAFAHTYLRDHRQLDIEHDGKPLSAEDAYVAESFIIAKGDERFQDWQDYEGNPVGDLTGAWATVIKLENPALQKAYRDGELDGVSLFGRAALERVDVKAAAQRIAEKLGKSQQETDMNKEELLAALGAFKTEIATMVKSALEGVKPAEKKDEAIPETAPTFKGDITKAADLEAFENELRAFELRKAIAGGTMTADKIAEMRKAMAEVAPSDAEAGIESADSPKERELKRELFKARKARNAPERQGASVDADEELRKANMNEGLEIAKAFNSRTVGASSGMRVVEKR